MLSEIYDDELREAFEPTLLAQLQQERMLLAAVRLRRMQSLSGIYADMLEEGRVSIVELNNIHALLQNATQRATEELSVVGASLDCQGIA